MKETSHLSLDYDRNDATAGVLLIDNPPPVNSPKEIVNKYNNTLVDIRQDLDSFIFGLSQLYMLADKQSEFAERIILLKTCIYDAIKKVNRLIK